MPIKQMPIVGLLSAMLWKVKATRKSLLKFKCYSTVNAGSKQLKIPHLIHLVEVILEWQ